MQKRARVAPNTCQKPQQNRAFPEGAARNPARAATSEALAALEKALAAVDLPDAVRVAIAALVNAARSDGGGAR